MSKIGDCLPKTGAGEQLGLRLRHEVEGFRHAIMITGKYTADQAKRLAEDAAIAAQAADIARRRRQKGLQILAMHRTAQQVASHPNGKGTGVMSLLVKDLGSRAGYSNVDMRSAAILGRYHSIFREGLQKLRTTMLGLRQDKELARRVVRELFGEATGDDSAASIAKAWGEAAETARKDYNKAGGAIPHRQDWGLPQIHDEALVGKVSREEWIDFILPKLDRESILDSAGRPMGDLEMRVTLEKMYDTIRTGGLSDIVHEGRGRGPSDARSVANRHRDPRFLVFKSPDDWLEYMDRFGPQDIFATMTDHLHRMANEVAIMEVLGPNPDATYRYLRDLAILDGMGERSAWFLDAVYDEVTGKVSNGRWATLADFGKSVRNFLAASKLGAAMLSALTDPAFNAITAKYRGLVYTKIMRRQLSLLKPGNEEDRLFAVRQGLVADAWVTRALAANRFTEVTGAGVTAKLADFTMRASGLSAWTDAGKKAFGMEFQAFIADNAGKTFGELPKPLRRTFSQYGITEELWDTLRSGDSFIEHKGAQFFSPEQVMRRVDIEDGVKLDIATRIQEMILTETRYAVPEPGAREMALIHMGTKRGDLIGELWRGGMLFKTFPVTALTNHIYRGILIQGGLKNKAAYLGALTVSTTILGALSLQLKEISKGKDPRPMDTPEFWAAANLQGGGLGIFGDFLYSDVNRFGQGPYKTFTSGPVGELVDRSLQLTYGNVQQAIKGEDMNLGGDIVNFLRGYSPGVSLWYTRLAYERAILDNLDKMADEGRARKRWSRQENRMMREYGQRFWWRPGKAEPDRAPGINKALGDGK